MSGYGPPAAMDSKVIVTQPHTRRIAPCRPKTPPPRRPPRPAVKQKPGSPSTHDAASVCTENTAPNTPLNSNQNNANRTTTVRTPSPGTRAAVAQDIRLHGNHSNITIIRVPINRNKRKAPDVPTCKGNTQPEAPPGANHRHSKSFSPADISQLTGSCRKLDTLRLSKGSFDDDVLTRSKPVVQYVKVVRKDRGTDPIVVDTCMPNKSLAQSKSADELNRLDIFLDLSDISCDYFCHQELRSSFLEEQPLKRQTLGFHSDVQTLLKHSHRESEHIYSLPQPASYSDTTLRAVKLITDKYDTLQRRRLHAASFREGDAARVRAALVLQQDRGDQEGFQAAGGEEGIQEGVEDTKEGRDEARLQDEIDSRPLGELDIASLPPAILTTPTIPELRESEDIVCSVTGICRKDILRMEMFYRGYGAEVTVCPCMADLYLGTSAGPNSDVSDWLLQYTGVPLFVLNTGQSNRKRELFIYLVELETGFPLWRDKINYLTNFEVVSSHVNMIKMRLSGSLSKMAKFDIFCVEAAVKFHEEFVAISADPNDELWRVSSEITVENRKALKKRRKKWKTFTVHDISNPCNFQHICSTDPTDPKIQASLQLLLESSIAHVKGQSSHNSSAIVCTTVIQTESSS